MIRAILERTDLMRHPTLVPLITRCFVSILACLWLVGEMRCQLEAAGVIPNDCCCGAPSPAPDGGAQPAKSQCSRLQSVLVLPLRLARGVPPPSLTADIEDDTPGLSAGDWGLTLTRPHSEVLSLAQSWQFRWRTALEPRAPSSASS